MRRIEIADLQRQKWGRLEVVGEGSGRVTSCGKRLRSILCRCECGVEKEVDLNSLRRGGVRSCGCIKREHLDKVRGRRGDSRSPEYVAWQSMKMRCMNPNATGWERYGGRGIRVCDEWVDSYEVFLRNVGRRPAADWSLDRIDPNGDYEPGNVRWATRRIQSRNRRNARWLVVNGDRIRLCDCRARWGLVPAQILVRLGNGWCETCAATIPSGDGTCPHKGRA